MQGRSPYDDVVEGAGEGSTKGPVQLYDERGRPVNPETRQINRDIIRSHNEVMQVIGVAEPETSNAERIAEVIQKQTEYEEETGQRLVWFGATLATVGVWGVNGLRHRIEVSTLPFCELSSC